MLAVCLRKIFLCAKFMLACVSHWLLNKSQFNQLSSSKWGCAPSDWLFDCCFIVRLAGSLQSAAQHRECCVSVASQLTPGATSHDLTKLSLTIGHLYESCNNWSWLKSIWLCKVITDYRFGWITQKIAIINIKIYLIMLSELELTSVVVTILQQASKHQMFSENSIPHACSLVKKDANSYLDNK